MDRITPVDILKTELERLSKENGFYLKKSYEFESENRELEQKLKQKDEQIEKLKDELSKANKCSKTMENSLLGNYQRVKMNKDGILEIVRDGNE